MNEDWKKKTSPGKKGVHSITYTVRNVSPVDDLAVLVYHTWDRDGCGGEQAMRLVENGFHVWGLHITFKADPVVV